MDISQAGGWVAAAASIAGGLITYGTLRGEVSGLKRDREDHSSRILNLEDARTRNEGRLGNIEGRLGIEPK